MTLELEHLETVIDTVVLPLTKRQDVAEEATTDLRRLGCFLLTVGQNILRAGGLSRTDLAAAIVTVETMIEGEAPDGSTPALSPIIDTQLKQLHDVRSTIVDSATALDHGTPRYAAVLASLDGVIAAATGLQALLGFAPALIPTDT
ncbi:hypothetical protein [Amycolatopsis pithecellobii]|uniref:Uncharacterized protein n=1 Tax=Amycolatopsis pithecellobii TaxID=664692 RepID=A0A6N7YYU7_9PSEU|nr:hypothetical protein [Amycolatopsis pithecellobii]MTD54073.1 hypothetical protein [Amycolatopsis pithecellobii]